MKEQYAADFLTLMFWKWQKKICVLLTTITVDVLLSKPLSPIAILLFAILSFCINGGVKKNSRVKISARVKANEEIK